MKTELVDISTLTADPENVRKHGERNIETIKGSLQRFGQQKPIVTPMDRVSTVYVPGLRVPSEIVPLTWQDVDWDRGRITVHSPKTEHFPGGESRVIPIFPEILPYLRDVFEAAEPGCEKVVTRCKRITQNVGVQFGRIIRRAGLKPWPKLFQNLRATRETELAENWPIHVVTDGMDRQQRSDGEETLLASDR